MNFRISKEAIFMYKRIFVLGFMVTALSLTFFSADKCNVIASAANIETRTPPHYTLEVNGKSIDMRVPPVIIHGRTLVPAREVFEALDATVTWDPTIQLVTVSSNEKIIQLLIDSTRAKLNRETVFLDVAPKLLSGRTFIPLRFVGESLGATVGWHPEEMKISIHQKNEKVLSEFEGLHYEIQDKEWITITIPNVTQYQEMFLQPNNISSYRLVVDLINTFTKKDPAKIELNAYPLTSIRYNPLDENTAKSTNLPLETVRVVMDLKKTTEFEINQVKNSLIIHIKLEDPNPLFWTPGLSRGSSDRMDGINQPDDLSVLQQISLGNDLVSIYHEAHGIIHTESKVQTFGNIAYHRTGDRIAILLNNTQLTSGRKDFVPLYASRYDSNNTQYMITFDRINASLIPGVYPINDDILHSITVMQIKDRTRLIIETKSPYLYHIFARPTLNDTAITLLKPPAKDQPLVVIDPGHGGVEPGAVHGGLTEKALNLDIAIRLKLILEDKGIQSYLLRADDSFLDLYERAYIANFLNASLFLSIHNNAYVSTTRGTETLYIEPSKPSSKFTGKDFTTLIQNTLINHLGTVNRGIVNRPNLVVLRETTMPAALAEIAFMTNPQDMAMLQDPAFRQRSANALATAIEISLQNSK
jgi:N-acetylmuramoyl-L-alanine amidase